MLLSAMEMNTKVGLRIVLCQLTVHLRHGELESPTKFTSLGLAGPSCFQKTSNSKKNQRISKIKDGINNIFIITHTRATLGKSRLGNLEAGKICHNYHETNNSHEESKPFFFFFGYQNTTWVMSTPLTVSGEGMRTPHLTVY